MSQPIGPGSSPRSRHQVSIPLYLILTLVTFFIFNLYWNYRQMVADCIHQHELNKIDA